MIPSPVQSLKPDLHVAALKNDVPKLCELLEYGVDVNEPAKGSYTALHIACHFGHAEVVAVRAFHRPVAPASAG